MRYNLRSIPETVTVRPALAGQVSGLSPYDLRAMAEPGPGVIIRAVRMPLGTEYRLDDVLGVVGMMTRVEPPAGGEEPF